MQIHLRTQPSLLPVTNLNEFEGEKNSQKVKFRLGRGEWQRREEHFHLHLILGSTEVGFCAVMSFKPLQGAPSAQITAPVAHTLGMTGIGQEMTGCNNSDYNNEDLFQYCRLVSTFTFTKHSQIPWSSS